MKENKGDKKLPSKALVAILVFAAFLFMPLVASAQHIDVEKLVQDPVTGDWVEGLIAYVGDTLTFKIDFHNDGDVGLKDIVVHDWLPGSMEYADNAWLQIPGTGWISITPLPPTTGPSGTTHIVWFPGDYLYPSEVMTILFDAKVVEAGWDYNEAGVCGDSLVQPYDTVCDYDDATIYALPVPQPELCPDEYRWSAYHTPGYEWDPFPELFRSWNDVHFVNNGPSDALNVVATISYAPANVAIVDGVVMLGDIPAGSGAWSSDFFELKVDMTNPQDPNEGIKWTVEYDVHHVVENVPEFCVPE